MQIGQVAHIDHREAEPRVTRHGSVDQPLHEFDRDAEKSSLISGPSTAATD